MPALAVRNFGCRANQAEAFAWSEDLLGQGVRLTADWSRSDVVLVNSCTLTGRTDRDVRKFLRRVARDNPAARLVVTGCYAERLPAEVAALPGVVAVVPNAEKDTVPRRVLDALGAPGAAATDAVTALRKRAFVKVQDGCDGGCAFCVIPSVRGRSVSVPPGEAAARVGELAGRGFREVVLSGIHLSSYGRDLEPQSSLAELVRGLAAVAGLGRLRLSSLDPRRTDARLVEELTAEPKVCRHFHLSLQHASERVLRLMGRSGGPEEHDRILREFRRQSPDAALGADVIAGFPGEGEEDFRELIDFLERSPLTYFHVFPFSPRPGTAAAERPRPSEAVVAERTGILRRLAAQKAERFRRGFAGRELEAVVIRSGEDGAEALTDNDIRVRVPAARAAEREFIRVVVA